MYKISKNMNKMTRRTGLLVLIACCFESQTVEARGCNRPTLQCDGTGLTKTCIWYDHVSCGFCSKKECTKHKGCKWTGVFKKHCRADFATGKDPIMK